MKRTLFIVAGLGLLAGALYFGSQLWAQGTGSKPPSTPPAAQPLRTRVACVNFLHVIKNYKKAQKFQSYVKDQEEIYNKKEEPLRTRGLAIQAELQKADCPDREAKEKQLKKAQAEITEMREEFQKNMVKQHTDWMVCMYKEVQEAAATFAKAYEIDLVVHYSDPTNPPDLDSPRNIERKIFTVGEMMPLYMHQQMEISAHIVKILNDKYEAAAGTKP